MCGRGVTEKRTGRAKKESGAEILDVSPLYVMNFCSAKSAPRQPLVWHEGLQDFVAKLQNLAAVQYRQYRSLVPRIPVNSAKEFSRTYETAHGAGRD